MALEKPDMDKPKSKEGQTGTDGKGGTTGHGTKGGKGTGEETPKGNAPKGSGGVKPDGRTLLGGTATGKHDDEAAKEGGNTGKAIKIDIEKEDSKDSKNWDDYADARPIQAPKNNPVKHTRQGDFQFFGNNARAEEGDLLDCTLYAIYDGRQVEVPGMKFKVSKIENDIVELVPLKEYEYTIHGTRKFFKARLRIPMNSFNYFKK